MSTSLKERFLIRGQLGRGASARVWSAVDRESGRAVAVKVLAHAKDPVALARFQREIEVLERLEHPHIVRILDHGVDEKRPWMAMELATRTVQHVLRQRGPATVQHTILTGIQLCGALQAAHDAGVIHRDVKPSNLLVMADGLRVSDFGIARIAESQQTLSGTALGSLAFMPPEQRIDARAVSPATDVFSAAITLFVLCTGLNPFDLHLEGADTHRWQAVPPALREPLRAATRSDPPDRIGTARDLADALLVAAEPASDREGLELAYARSVLPIH